MTAIAGCVDPAGQSELHCARILRAQRIYGEGSPSTVRLGEAAFGIDLHSTLPEGEDCGQPLLAGTRFMLVADARVDNRSDLIAELGCDSGQSDSEIVLAAWTRWQDCSLQKLVGDYAFALWDDERRSLTLVRDPIGQRPLFYSLRNGRVAFATTPAGLLADGQRAPAFDFERLSAMLLGREQAFERSYFEGINAVRPAHAVSISAHGISAGRFWSPPQDVLRLSDEGYVEAYHEQLRTAVAARLRRKSGAAGVHLSSGLDSSAVAAMAAGLQTDSKPTAFTSAPREGFDGPVPPRRIADESALAALTARKYGLEQIVVRPTSGVLAGLREHCRFYQDPNCNLVNMEWLKEVLARARTLGVSTLLSAEMGNLTIHAGGLPVLAEWLRTGALLRWWREARSAVRGGKARWRGVLINSFTLPDAFSSSLERRFRGVPGISDSGFVRQEWLGKGLAISRPREDYEGRYRGRLEQISAYDPGLFRKGSLGQFGIDERDPTADRRLIDFSFRLPPEQLLHDGVWRPLALRALKGLIPPEVLYSPLRGYQGADWYERIGPSEATELLEEISSSHSARELLDIDKMRDAIEQWPSGGWADMRQILIYRTRLPIALATGVFLQEFETVSTGSSID